MMAPEDTALQGAPAASAPPPDGGVPTEIDQLDPISSSITLTTGHTVEILPLKTRQLFRLMRIITRGGAGLLGTLKWSEGAEAFTTQLLAIVVWAIPEAENEAIDFVKSLVAIPTGKDLPETAEIAVALENPDLDDLVSILEVVIRRDGPHVQALGKRLRSLLEAAVKTGQITPAEAEAMKGGPAAETTEPPDIYEDPSTVRIVSPEASPEPSI